MITSYEQLKNNVVQAINELSGIKTIKANQNSPRPVRPYLTMKIATADDFGLPVSGPVDEINGEQTFSQQDEITVSIQCYGNNLPGEDPMDILRILIYKLATIKAEKVLSDKCLVYRRNEPIIDISAVLDQNNIEQRAGVDVIFGITFTQDPKFVSVIEDVNFGII